MYIENKETGEAVIGKVSFSKTRKTIYYKNKSFASLSGRGFGKANYYDVETREEYWISGPRKDGCDRLYAGPQNTRIDEDVAEEYLGKIRNIKKNKL